MINAQIDHNISNYSVEGSDEHLSQIGRGAAIPSFVATFGPGYLSELAYTFMGLNAVITWSKLFKYLLRRTSLELVHTFLLSALLYVGISSSCLNQAGI